MISLSGTFIIIGFIFLAKYQTQSLADQYHQNNINPNDFVLYFELTPEQITQFDKKFYSRNISDVSRGTQLQRHM